MKEVRKIGAKKRREKNVQKIKCMSLLNKERVRDY